MNRLLLLLAIVFVSSAALFAHSALREAPPLAIAAWRLTLAALFFLGWEFLSRRPVIAPVAMTRGEKGRLTLAGVCLALHFVTWFASLRDISIARSTLLVCTAPLWTVLSGLVLKSRMVSRVYWLALALAAVGIWLVTHTAANAQSAMSVRGDLLALSGGLFIAVYLLAVEGLRQSLSTRRQVTTTYSVAALILCVALLSQKGLTLQYSPSTWGAIVGMAVGPQILGHTLLNRSLRHFPSSTVAFATLLEPVIAALLAWLLLRQAVTIGQGMGGMLVLVGLALVLTEPSDKKTEVVSSL